MVFNSSQNRLIRWGKLLVPILLCCLCGASCLASEVMHLDGPAQPNEHLASAAILFEISALDRGVRIFKALPSFSAHADYSARGFSADVAVKDSLDGPGSQFGGSFSYSYPIKWFDLSFGVAPVWRHATKLPDRTDLFVETKFKPIQGIVPSIGYYLNVNGQTSQYTELKLAFPYEFNDRFRISSYWKWGFGDIYTPSWTATHSEFGVDTNYKLSKRIDLLAYAGMSIPFDGVKRFSGKTDPEGFLGLGLRYRY